MTSSIRTPTVSQVLLVLVGVILLVANAGYLTQHYEYSLRPANDEIVEYETLSEHEQVAVSDAVTGGINETVLAGLSNASVLTDDMVEYVRYRGRYYEVLVDDWESPANRSLTIREAPYTSRPYVHEYANLSTQGQTVVEKALASDDGSATRFRQPPPEFDTGGDSPEINNGYYYIRYEDSYYWLTVIQYDNLFLWLWFAFLGLVLPATAVVSYVLRWHTLKAAVPTVGIVVLSVPLSVSFSAPARLPLPLYTGLVILSPVVLLSAVKQLLFTGPESTDGE